jgi:hypothetical protein
MRTDKTTRPDSRICTRRGPGIRDGLGERRAGSSAAAAHLANNREPGTQGLREA